MCRKLEMISLLKNQGREFLLLAARILVSAHPAITLTRCFFRHRTSGGVHNQLGVNDSAEQQTDGSAKAHLFVSSAQPS
jgi:hypothetical protein